MEGPSVTTTEAAAAPAPQSASDKLADFEDFLGAEEGDEEEELEAGEGAEEGDDLDLEEASEAEDEPETAIDAPASLNAEEKKAFAQLPMEAQQAWAASETRRNTQVQEATTKASEAQRTAEARAATSDAQAKALYGQQLETFVAAFEPERPDPRRYNDQLAYLTDKAQYDDAKAQHDQLVQHARGIQSEADTEAQGAFIAQRDRELLTIPEVANPETRKDYLDRAFGIAAELGLDQSELATGATASDIKALAQVAEWRAKAIRLDKAVSAKMQRVRAGKGKTLRPGTAPHADARAARSTHDWQKVKGARSKEAQAEAFADYMGL